jgi:voltage-gated potassium channel
VPGAIFTVLGFIVLRLISSLLLTHWLHWYSHTYGALGIVMAIVSWMMVFATIMVLAAALSPALAHRRGPIEGQIDSRGELRPQLMGRRVPRPNLVERRMSRFLREPPSVRTAASVIVTATALAVVAGGVLFRILDHHEYANIWIGMWLAIQTVTTVGYGDVTPKDDAGRLVAAFIMLEGIAFVAITTAAVTSTFVARAQRVEERLDRLDTMLRKLNPGA